MPKIIFQADDYAITRAATDGIIQAVAEGFVRATGLFTNRPDAGRAAKALRDHEGLDLGMDFNFVTGYSLLPARDIPGLVAADGSLRSSHAIHASYDLVSQEGMTSIFTVEPFEYEQTLAEARAQYARFIELVGRKPAYLHHHSIITPGLNLVIHQIGAEEGITVMDDFLAPASDIFWVPNTWYTKPFGATEQAAADPVSELENLLDDIAAHPLNILITHPGLVDAELLDITSYHVIRARDLAAVTSPRIADGMNARGIEITSFSAEGLLASPAATSPQ